MDTLSQDEEDEDRIYPTTNDVIEPEENQHAQNNNNHNNLNDSKFLMEVDLPPLPETEPHVWNEFNEKQLRSALIGACKRMPRNAEAHFHLGLMYMRKCDGEEALRSFQHCKQIYDERLEQYYTNALTPPSQLLAAIARLRSYTAQAAHMAASSTRVSITSNRFLSNATNTQQRNDPSISRSNTSNDEADRMREERSSLLKRLQDDLVAATNLDNSQPDVWNALAVLHLTEGGYEGAQQILTSIHTSFPEYLDALNNLGLSELASGDEEAAISCFQKVLLCDREHSEALSNYGLVLLRHGMYDAAIRAFEGAVKDSSPEGRGLCYAWGGLAVARGAVGNLQGAEQAAQEAERTADPLNRSKFTMLLTSIEARSMTEDLRQGMSSESSNKQDVHGLVSSLSKTKQEPEEEQNQIETRRNSGQSSRDARPAIDNAVLKLRTLAREIKSSSASTILGAVLRLRHEYSFEESGNRNFGAEAAERFVEALEEDDSDAAAWVQLALLQMGTGEYTSARDFAVQAVSRNPSIESAWSALGVAYQLNDELSEANSAYDKAISVIMNNYNKANKQSFSKGEALEDTEEQETDDFDDSKPVIPTTDDNNPMTEGSNSNQKDIPANSEGGGLNEAGLNALSAMYNNIGNMKRQEGRCFNEALSAYEKSLHFGGENAVVYNNLALLYISAGGFDNAERMLEHALKLDPHFDCALSNRLKLRALVRQKELEDSRRAENSENSNEQLDSDQ